MAKDKQIILPEKAELVEKWLPVIEGKGKWEYVVDGAPKVNEKDYYNLATQFEVMSNTVMTEATTSGDVAKYNPVLIPMLRRIGPALIGNEIFGVQPLTGPTGLIFALRSSYTGTTDTSYKRSNSVILTLADAANFPVGGDIAGETGGVGVVRHKEDNNLIVEVTSGTFTVGDNVDDANAYTATVTTISAKYENETAINMLFSNYSGLYSTSAGESLTTDMKEIGFDVDSKSVEAESRKLKAKWKIELEEDLDSVHNMSAEQILSNVASEEIVSEKNRQFIDAIDTYATQGSVTTWDYDTADGRWEQEKYVNLQALISRVKKQVGKTSKRGVASFMIASSDVVAALEMLPSFDSSGADPYLSTYAGMFMGMSVYTDLFADGNYILLGYKGADEIDAGMFYSPYIPLKISKGMLEESGQPVMFFHERSALTENPFGAKNYYKKIVVNNLPYAS